MFSKTYHPLKTLVTVFLLLSALLLNGCASSPDPIDPNEKNRSVVFGYIDMSDGPSDELDWVTVRQYKPRTKKGYYSAAVKDGLFYHIGLPNGSFQVDDFGRNTRFLSNTRYIYNFGGKGRNQTARKIKKPGVYFMGSYKYKNISSGSIWKPDNFKMIKVKKPREKELLKKLLKIMQSDSDLAQYKNQIRRMKQRLKRLK